MQCVHFVGFKDDRYWNAVKIWGMPYLIHRGWDIRAYQEVGDDDIVIFAKGEHDQPVRNINYGDLDEQYFISK